MGAAPSFLTSPRLLLALALTSLAVLPACGGPCAVPELDFDLDGFTCGEGDCLDLHPDVYPGAPQELCDGYDTNCDGVRPPTDADADHDGWLGCAGDCDDTNPQMHPGAPEICDLLDSNCDLITPTSELVDADQDWFVQCQDCDDNDPTVFPDAPEACDGVDADCDGIGGAGSRPQFYDPDPMTQQLAAPTGTMSARLALRFHSVMYPGLIDAFAVELPPTLSPDADVSLAVLHVTNSVLGTPLFDQPMTWDVLPLSPPVTGSWWTADALEIPVVPGYIYTGIFSTSPLPLLYEDVVFNPFALEATGMGNVVLGAASFLSAPSPGMAWEDLTPEDLNAEVITGRRLRQAFTFVFDTEVDEDNNGIPYCLDAGERPLVEICEGLDTDGDGVLPITEVDHDGDGFVPCSPDCGILDGSVFPIADEVCDGVDSDCLSSQGDDEDDADGDGFALCDGDCQDADPDIFPGGVELCDGKNNDCAPPNPMALSNAERDDDGDGYVPCAGFVSGAVPAEQGGVPILGGGDCDDGDNAVYPGAWDGCDLVDANCDGDLEEDLWRDSDGDGLPNCVETDADGDGEDGSTDCDDLDPSRYSGAPESCDWVDSDCDDDVVDLFLNSDLDVLPNCIDCADYDASIPGPEVPDDGVDQDCNGYDLIECPLDADLDGYGSEVGTALWSGEDCEVRGLSEETTDCDDSDRFTNPGGEDISMDGKDQDCSGFDGDGVPLWDLPSPAFRIQWELTAGVPLLATSTPEPIEYAPMPPSYRRPKLQGQWLFVTRDTSGVVIDAEAPTVTAETFVDGPAWDYQPPAEQQSGALVLIADGAVELALIDMEAQVMVDSWELPTVFASSTPATLGTVESCDDLTLANYPPLSPGVYSEEPYQRLAEQYPWIQFAQRTTQSAVQGFWDNNAAAFDYPLSLSAQWGASPQHIHPRYWRAVCRALAVAPTTVRGAVTGIDFIRSADGTVGITVGNQVGLNFQVLEQVLSGLPDDTPHPTARVLLHELAHVATNAFAPLNPNIWLPPAGGDPDYIAARNFLIARRHGLGDSDPALSGNALSYMFEAIGSSAQALSKQWPAPAGPLPTQTEAEGIFDHVSRRMLLPPGACPSGDIFDGLSPEDPNGTAWDYNPWPPQGLPWTGGFAAWDGNPWGSAATNWPPLDLYENGWYGARCGHEDIAQWFEVMAGSVLEGLPACGPLSPLSLEDFTIDNIVSTNTSATGPATHLSPHLAKLYLLDYAGLVPAAARAACLGDKQPNWSPIGRLWAATADPTLEFEEPLPFEYTSVDDSTFPVRTHGSRWFRDEDIAQRIAFVGTTAASAGNGSVIRVAYPDRTSAMPVIRPTGLYWLGAPHPGRPSPVPGTLNRLELGWETPQAPARVPGDTTCLYDSWPDGHRYGWAIDGVAIVIAAEPWWKGVVLPSRMVCGVLGDPEYGEFLSAPTAFLATAPPW